MRQLEETQIRQRNASQGSVDAAREFIAASAERLEWPGKGPIAAIHLAKLATLSEREAQLPEEAAVLRQRTRNLNAKVRRPPVRRLGYPAVISHAFNGGRAPQNARNGDEPAAQSVGDRIVQLRRGAGPVIWPSVKALLFAGAASTVIAIEYALLNGVLDAVFPPVAGMDQAIGNGLMAASFVAVVTASYLILSRAGQRVARFLDRAGLAAIALYLAGSGVLIASGVSASGLVGVADASLVANGGGWNSDRSHGAPDAFADGIASIGMLGLAVAFSALGTLSLIAVHGSIMRVRLYIGPVSSSMRDRREAAALQSEYDAIAAGEARIEAESKRLADERTAASRTTAIEVSTLFAPALAAANSLLTQLDLSGNETVSVPDDLLHELAGYDREVLRQRVERLRAKSEVETIQMLIDRLFQPQARSFQGGRACNVYQ